MQNNKIFTKTFLLIILAELLSFFGYFYPLINSLTFFIIMILTIYVSLRRLEYGLYVLLAELFIGSFGYLFYFETAGARISIRLALWLIVMSVWLSGVILSIIKKQKPAINFFKLKAKYLLIFLFLFFIWGIINGWRNGNLAENIFFDFNNWLYLLLIFPASTAFLVKENIGAIKSIFFAAVSWLSLKTILLAYFFSHNFYDFNPNLYQWTRNYGLGEITQSVAGFSRIFIQSHIFVLIGFFFISFYLLKIFVEAETRLIVPGGHSLSAKQAMIKKFNLIAFLARPRLKYALWQAWLLSSIVISFSRSFWVGLAIGLIFIFIISIFKLKSNIKKIVSYYSLLFFSALLSLIFIFLVVKFPWPAALGAINPLESFSYRARQISGEAGASSRWRLLPALWQKINTAPILGLGFGATVTYQSSDPRALQSSADGLYTTYAFEWGWLDIWLKLGLIGLLIYLLLFIKLIIKYLKNNSYFSLSMTASLLVLMSVNFFSPYLNHPLGLGFIIMAIVLMDNEIGEKRIDPCANFKYPVYYRSCNFNKKNYA